MTDAQDGEQWIVPTVLAATLLDDPVAAETAYAATEPLSTDGDPLPSDLVWRRAARVGLADPELAKAARACFAAAESALARPGASRPCGGPSPTSPSAIQNAADVRPTTSWTR